MLKFSRLETFPTLVREESGFIWTAISHLTQRAQNVTFPLSPLFPRGRHSVNIPLSCSVGDYKSKLQLYRDRRGHPATLPQPPPPSSSMHSHTSSIPSSLPSRFISLLHKCILPLMVSPGTCVWPSLFLVWVCKDRAATLPEAKKENNTTSVPYRYRKHVPTYGARAEVCKFHTDKRVWSSAGWSTEGWGFEQACVWASMIKVTVVELVTGCKHLSPTLSAIGQGHRGASASIPWHYVSFT